jgi:hypothetical protein
MLDWLDGEKVRPYVYVREENRISRPGSRYDSDWFPFEPIYLNPLHMDNVNFANQILTLESQAFAASAMEMPRWVFYDCAIVPGFVAGFAYKTSELPRSIRDALTIHPEQEWTPISLFIIIPTMAQGEWVAHNLSSLNHLLPKEERFYGLGFLTKAFGLWYANVESCVGMTQWDSPAVRLHSHYGEFEILTSYTPVHSYAKTMTYRLKVDPNYWSLFFTKRPVEGFLERYEEANFEVNPLDERSLIEFQHRLESKQGPYFLKPNEILTRPIGSPLSVYRPRS